MLNTLATRKLLLFAVALYAIVPLPWIIWRPEGLFYNFHLSQLPLIAAAFGTFFIGWCCGEQLRPAGGWFAISAPSGRAQRWPVATLAIIGALLCSLAANLVLYSMGALAIDESEGRARIPFLTTLGNAHIFSLIYTGCMLFTSTKGRKPPLMLALAVISVLATISLGLIENRRAAVVLPLVVYAVLMLLTGRGRQVWKLLLVVPFFIVLFAATTYYRTVSSSGVEFDESTMVIGGDALFGRLGNPLLVLDPVFDYLRTTQAPMDPHTIQSIFAGLPNLGLVAPPFATGYGNEFGRQLELLPSSNDYTGINSGWIGELLLLGGFPAVLLGGVLLGALAATAWRLISATHPAGIFLRVMVVIFIVSGFQMEVPFPIVSLLRAALIAILLAAADWYLANKFRPS
jgi:hypothetical protein